MNDPVTAGLTRIAVVTDEMHPSIAAALSGLAALGIGRVDLRFLDGHRVPDITHDAFETVRDAVARGWSVGSLSPGILKGKLRGAHLAHELEVVLPATLRLARELAVTKVVVFGGDRTSQLRDVLPVLRDAAATAREAGVELVLENSSLCAVSTSVELTDVARAVGLRVVWDPANAAAAGEVDLSRAAQRVSPHVASVHVRDWDPTGWQRLGSGVIDWEGQIAVLNGSGYQGWYCVESHRPDDPGATPANIRALAALLQS